MIGSNKLPKNVRCTLETEGLKIDVARDSVLLPKGSSDDEQGQILLRTLQQNPLELAALIEQGTIALLPIIERLQLVPPWKLTENSFETAVIDCGDTAWASDSTGALQLALLGWSPESLTEAVWAAWANVSPPIDVEKTLSEITGRSDDTQRGSVSEGPRVAEWLAEMADQGKLHQPGPQFHDVEIRLDSYATEAGNEPEVLTALKEQTATLLPGVFGAAKGLGLVANGVMQRAEELAAPLRKK